MTNQCNIEVVEDSSGSDSEVEALLMGKSAANKFASSFPSPTVISNVVRNMWNVSNLLVPKRATRNFDQFKRSKFKFDDMHLRQTQKN